MRKRHYVQAAICTFLGLLATVGLALWLPTQQQGPHRARPRETAQELWDRFVNEGGDYGPATYHWNCGALGCDFLTLDAKRPAALPVDPSPRMMITRGGFPFRALEGMHSWNGVEPEYSWAIPIQPRNPNVAWLSILPCKPMFPGFLLDVLFFAGLPWLVFFGPYEFERIARAQARRRIGRCPQCGYDLRNDLAAGCPECGWRRKGPSQP